MLGSQELGSWVSCLELGQADCDQIWLQRKRNNQNPIWKENNKRWKPARILVQFVGVDPVMFPWQSLLASRRRDSFGCWFFHSSGVDTWPSCVRAEGGVEIFVSSGFRRQWIHVTKSVIVCEMNDVNKRNQVWKFTWPVALNHIHKRTFSSVFLPTSSLSAETWFTHLFTRRLLWHGFVYFTGVA